LAAELVRLGVNVIAAPGDAIGQAAKAATATIPIIFVAGVDPIEAGMVASLNQPGGNATGVSMLNAELAPKRLELLHELVPGAAVMALLVNPKSPSAGIVSRNVQAAARTLGLELHILQASSEQDFEAVFADLVRLRAGGLLMATDGLFNSRSGRLGALTRISHTTECIGAANQRKPLCRNELSMICGAPRCRQSVAGTFLDLNLLKAARWWRRSTLARSPRMPGRCFWVRQIAPSG